MKIKKIATSKSRMLRGLIGLILAPVVVCHAAPRSGEGIVVARVGKVKASYVAGNAHTQTRESKNLNEGQSVGEGTQIVTGKDGRVCMVLSPGAMICIAPETDLTLTTLRHASDGLPKTEDDLMRLIQIDLAKGRVMVHGSAPTASFNLKVVVPEGLVESAGGTFVVAQTDDAEWAVLCEEYAQSVTPRSGKLVSIDEGGAMELALVEGKVELNENTHLWESPVRKFEVCNCYFQDVEPFFSNPLTFNRAGLANYITSEESFEYVGPVDSTKDISPAIPTTVTSQRRTAASASTPATAGRWPTTRIWNWYEQVGVLKGVNYISRNAVNSTDMWMKDTFDKDVIDEELGWAKKAGYTTLRVQLQYVVWEDNPDEFKDRLDEFLDIAEKHDIRVVPVLFDDMNTAGKDPYLGEQPLPLEGQNNSQWVPSPGSMITERDAWETLEDYTRDIIEEFEDDDRIVYWDLYNHPGDNGLWEKSLPFMDQVFLWARDVDPDQPIAVAAWSHHGSAMSTRGIERSDLVTFSSFEDDSQMEGLVKVLRDYDRPIICADWMLRQKGNTFEKILPVFSVHSVGWFSRGLVQGETQQWVQEEGLRLEDDPDVWQHDVLDEDGEAYSDEELKLIQAFRFNQN